MGAEEIKDNLSKALLSFADSISTVSQVGSTESPIDYPEFVYELLAFFPLDKVDWQAGTYDQYLYDLQKTVVDNYEKGNYQVSYFYAHLIFMSYVYYCVEKAYQFQPERLKDIFYPLNAYRGKEGKKPSLDSYKSIYDFSLFPEKDIFKIFHVIGMDDALIKDFASYINNRDDFAHATGQGNISLDSLRQNIRTIIGNMESLLQVFQPHLKTIYVKYLFEQSTHLYHIIVDSIGDFISDTTFSLKDLDFLCRLGMRAVQDENQLSHEQYLSFRKVHCAFIEYCLDNIGVEAPEQYESLRDQTYLFWKYENNAAAYVENELGIDEYSCVKDGGEFPVHECPECGEKQLVYDADADKYHCFHCSTDFDGADLTICEDCGVHMHANEIPLCENCLQRKMEED